MPDILPTGVFSLSLVLLQLERPVCDFATKYICLPSRAVFFNLLECDTQNVIHVYITSQSYRCVTEGILSPDKVLLYMMSELSC